MLFVEFEVGSFVGLRSVLINLFFSKVMFFYYKLVVEEICKDIFLNVSCIGEFYSWFCFLNSLNFVSLVCFF